MRKIVGERNPTVLRFLINPQRRRWEVGVIKRTDCNTDMIRPQVGFPKHRRSACRAEMHSNLSSLLPVADIDFGRSLGANLFLLKEGSNAEHRAGSPLTLATMAGGYGIGIGGCFDTQGTATAMRGSRHKCPSIIRLGQTTRGPASKRPFIADRARFRCRTPRSVEAEMITGQRRRLGSFI